MKIKRKNTLIHCFIARQHKVLIEHWWEYWSILEVTDKSNNKQVRKEIYIKVFNNASRATRKANAKNKTFSLTMNIEKKYGGTYLRISYG